MQKTVYMYKNFYGNIAINTQLISCHKHVSQYIPWALFSEDDIGSMIWCFIKDKTVRPYSKFPVDIPEDAIRIGITTLSVETITMIAWSVIKRTKDDPKELQKQFVRELTGSELPNNMTVNDPLVTIPESSRESKSCLLM